VTARAHLGAEISLRKLANQTGGAPCEDLTRGLTLCRCQKLPLVRWWIGMYCWTATCLNHPEPVTAMGTSHASLLFAWNQIFTQAPSAP
jgi:hypothetical protein